MKGYVNNESANEKGFTNGWFRTGDQGVMENGYLRLTGRIKELVNRGGEKISPVEVDGELLAFPGVAEAVCFAVPDEKYGEEVNAAVVWQKGYSGGIDELMKFLEGRIAKFKIPKKVFECIDFPRTATGKIQRRVVANHFLHL